MQYLCSAIRNSGREVEAEPSLKLGAETSVIFNYPFQPRSTAEACPHPPRRAWPRTRPREEPAWGSKFNYGWRRAHGTPRTAASLSAEFACERIETGLIDALDGPLGVRIRSAIRIEIG